MEISVCMIVKNEEKLLRRCLDSLNGLYEELIIVDTGSTDKTKEIAWEYTDEVYDFEWVSDFAAARNFAFSKCTKDYIYTVDADEVLDAENMEKFRVLKGYLDPKYEIVKMWYLTTGRSFSKDSAAGPGLIPYMRACSWNPRFSTVTSASATCRASRISAETARFTRRSSTAAAHSRRSSTDSTLETFT